MELRWGAAGMIEGRQAVPPDQRPLAPACPARHPGALEHVTETVGTTRQNQTANAAYDRWAVTEVPRKSGHPPRAVDRLNYSQVPTTLRLVIWVSGTVVGS